MIDQTRLFDGARDLLLALRDAGLKVALASSAIPRHADHALELLDADSCADGWTTADDAEESKPDPELLAKALERVGGSRAVMIGDTVWDVRAGTALGVPTLALRSGGVADAELRDAGAASVHDDARDLAEHLDQALAALSR